ncbi:MAG: UbiD family decarboxylase [Deltaproteobacteria bacterium]|nr:UbiD family decarboxylase [Deltaproteobacteria bacterium]
MASSPLSDFREFIRTLEAEADLVRIKEQVDARFDIAAYTRRSCDLKGPAFLFDQVAGYPGWQVVAGSYGVLRRLLRALDCDQKTAVEKYRAAINNPLAPVRVSGPAPHQAILWEGSDLDLARLPITTHSEKDAAPYITAGVQVVRDANSQMQHLGIHRMQVKGPRRLGFWGGNLRRITRTLLANEERGVETEIAVVLGAPPAFTMASTARVSHHVDKTGIAGALIGKPLEIYPCKRIGVDVPAAEIVLEGILLSGVREEEGPFGEFTGCYSGKRLAPVMEVRAITMREEPLYQDALTGMPMTEDQTLTWLPRTVAIAEDASRVHPEILAVNWAVGDGGIYQAVIAIRKRVETEPWNVISHVLSGNSLVKYCVVVDDDIDVFDAQQVAWAINTRVQPHRDVHIYPTMVGAPLDPSAPLPNQTSKLGIDATIPAGEERWRYEKIRVPGSDQVKW